MTFNIKVEQALLFVVESNVGELLPACPVHLVCEARVVRVQLRPVTENLVGKTVQFLNLLRKPWNCTCRVEC